MKTEVTPQGAVPTGDWGAQRNAAWGNPDGFLEVVMLNLALNDE